jgi:hypothetical protein
MHALIDVARGLGVVAGVIVLAGLLVVGVLSWLLNRPD